MFKQRRILELRHLPVQILQPPIDTRIAVPYGILVRLEQRHIDRVEADNRDVEPDIDFRDGRAVIEEPRMRGRREMCFYFIEVGEEIVDGDLVGALRLGETAFAVI